MVDCSQEWYTLPSLASSEGYHADLTNTTPIWTQSKRQMCPPPPLVSVWGMFPCWRGQCRLDVPRVGDCPPPCVSCMNRTSYYLIGRGLGRKGCRGLRRALLHLLSLPTPLCFCFYISSGCDFSTRKRVWDNHRGKPCWCTLKALSSPSDLSHAHTSCLL